jgi:hypothetical protein
MEAPSLRAMLNLEKGVPLASPTQMTPISPSQSYAGTDYLLKVARVALFIATSRKVQF